MSASWTAQVYFLTGKRWEGPFATTVTAAAASAAAARAVTHAKRRLRRRARIVEAKINLQRARPLVTS